MDVSTFFKLGKTQSELDFVNIDPHRDTPVFVDPYALEIKRDEWSTHCADHLRSFFTSVIEALRTDNIVRARHLTRHLGEARETFLGVSKGLPQGRGLGPYKSGELLTALAESRAVKTGVLTDLAEAELFIKGIGRDIISDLTTNIIRGPLIAYTKAQCELLGIPLVDNCSVGPTWNFARENWDQDYHQLPKLHGMPFILVPKYSVRKSLSLDSQEFYNHHMIEFLQSEYLAASSSLVYTLKSGRRRVYKKDVKERHPFIKDDLADFVKKHPSVLQLYRDLKGAQGALEAADLEEHFDEKAFAEALSVALASIPSGNEAATCYHSFMIGVIEFLFYPSLIYPVKENEIHDGRKRIDIKYTNAADSGFFHRVLTAPQTRAINIMVECKNYTKELKNPELDQMSSRFGHTRSFFGILCCRKVEDKNLIAKRCKDTSLDNRGFVLVIDDEDIKLLLYHVVHGHRKKIDRELQRRFDYLLT